MEQNIPKSHSESKQIQTKQNKPQGQPQGQSKQKQSDKPISQKDKLSVLTSNLLGPIYSSQGLQSLSSEDNLLISLLSSRLLPPSPLSPLQITHLLNKLALMDTNNQSSKIGVGEREGRIFSQLVSNRHYHLAHGMGRSGDVNAIQPKAAGSSLILKLTTSLLSHALNLQNYKSFKSTNICLLPLCTGMSLTLVFMRLATLNPQAKYIIIPRIDQKTCLKCILAAGMTPLVIQGIQVGDTIQTNIHEMQTQIDQYKHQILAVMSVTSCFAPRLPDNIKAIAKLCHTYHLPHVINNAYGLQCPTIGNTISNLYTSPNHRIDYIIQSLDKNYMVPVGGAIVLASQENIQGLQGMYPGRASISPIVDLFITLLEMGTSTLKHLIDNRQLLFVYCQSRLQQLANSIGERLLNMNNANSISMAMTLTTLGHHRDTVGKLGQVLFGKRVMGARVVYSQTPKIVCGQPYTNYGSHMEDYSNIPYITMAVAIGMEKIEVDTFIDKLEKSILEVKKKIRQKKEMDMKEEEGEEEGEEEEGKEMMDKQD